MNAPRTSPHMKPPILRPGLHTTPGAPAGRPAAPVAAIDPVRVVREHLWIIIGSVVVGALAGAIAYFILLRVAPTYTAEAYWKVNSPNYDPAQITPTDEFGHGALQVRMATQAAEMVQPSILRAAAASDLLEGTQWRKQFTAGSGTLMLDAAVEDLSQRVRATPYGETSLIRLSITGPNRSDLERILLTIREVFEQSIQTEKSKYRNSTASPYTARCNDLRLQLQTVEREIRQLRDSNGLNGALADHPIMIQIATLQEAISLDRQQIQTFAGMAESIQARLDSNSLTFNDEERMLAEQDSQIQTIDQRLLALRTRLNSLTAGPNHPEIRKLERQIRAEEEERATVLNEVLAQNLNVLLLQTNENLLSLRSRVDENTQSLTTLFESAAQLRDAQNEVMALEADRVQLSEALTQAERSLAELELWIKQTRSDPVTLVQDVTAKRQPTFPQIKVMIPLGIVLIGGMVTGVIFLRELTDKRIKGPADVAHLPHGRILGVVPHTLEDPSGAKRVEMAALDSPRSVLAESVRQLRNLLIQSMEAEHEKVLLVVAGQPGAGATSLVSNVAISAAQSERTVLVIDANFRRPDLARVFGVRGEPGLGDVIAGDVTIESAVQRTDVDTLRVLAAGSAPNRVVERFATERFRMTLSRLRDSYDLILIDCPPAVVAGDCLLIAQQADATMLVVKAMQEERGLVSRLINQLRETPAHHLGVVLNAARSSAGGYFKRNYRQMDSYQRGGMTKS